MPKSFILKIHNDVKISFHIQLHMNIKVFTPGYTVVMVFASCMLFGQVTDYSGTYANEDGSVKLNLQPSSGTYSGTFIVQGQEYMFTGKMMEGNIHGTYTYMGYPVDLAFGLVEGVYYIESEGYVIEMVKEKKSSMTAIAGQTVTTPEPAIQNLTGTVTSSNGTLHKDPFGHFTFNSLFGWTVGEEEGSFGMANPTISQNAAITITPHQYNSAQQLMADVQDVRDENESVYLTSKSQSLSSGQIITSFDGTAKGQKLQIKSLSLFSPFEGGVSVTAIVVGNEVVEKYFELARSVASSVKFTKPQKSAAAEQWNTLIKGRQLLYMKTEGGFADKWNYDLCSDGTFYYNSNSSGMSGGGAVLSYASQDRNAGTWRVSSIGSKVYLSLYKSDGSVSQMEITPSGQSKGQVLLNGNRHFITDNESCR